MHSTQLAESSNGDFWIHRLQYSSYLIPAIVEMGLLVWVVCAASEVSARPPKSNPQSPSPSIDSTLCQWVCGLRETGAWVSECSSANSESWSLSGSLLGGHLEGGLVGLGNWSGSLNAVELNVTVWGEVWTDATMGTVGSSTAGDGTLHHVVVDHALVSVELVAGSVSFQVNKEFANNLGRLLWPSSLGVFEWLQLCVSSNASRVPSEWNNLFVLNHILQVCNCLLQVPALNGTSNLISVLVVSSKVSNLAFSF